MGLNKMTTPNELLTASKTNLHSNFKVQLYGNKQHSDKPIKNLSIVCEGGGQRGIFTAGVLDTFLENNYFPFQSLLGVSAGAQNLSGYACGAIGYARDAILEFTTDKHFFNPLRFARGGNMLELDWYLDSLAKVMPLDLKKGVERLTGRTFHICASRRDNLQADYLPFNPQNMSPLIKASCALPLIYRSRAAVNGVEYWDGGVADSVPVKRAYQDGSDCIIVIRTQPRASINPLRIFPKNLRLKRLQAMSGLVQSYLRNYSLAMEFMDSPPEGVQIIDIAPMVPLKSRLLGSSRGELLQDYRSGQLCGMHFLDEYAWRIKSV